MAQDLLLVTDMKVIFIVLVLLLTIFGGEVSCAEVYKWVDEKGIVHFTDDMMQIPERYRGTIESIGVIEEKDETETVGEPSAKKKEDSYKDRFGRGEEYWKARVEEWMKKLKVLQEKMETLRIKYDQLTDKFYDSRSLGERIGVRKEREQVKNEMDQYKVQIEEAKEMLEKKIPEEAELYKAKPEWVKQ